jgi:hypothetical protein
MKHTQPKIKEWILEDLPEIDLTEETVQDFYDDLEAEETVESFYEGIK